MIKYLCQFFFENGWHYAGLMGVCGIFGVALIFWTPVKVSVSQNVTQPPPVPLSEHMPDSLRKMLAEQFEEAKKGK